MRATTVLTVILVIWIVSLTVALPNLIFSDTYTFELGGGKSRTVCYLNWPDGNLSTMDLA
jgi:hypothetical protein